MNRNEFCNIEVKTEKEDFENKNDGSFKKNLNSNSSNNTDSYIDFGIRRLPYNISKKKIDNIIGFMKMDKELNLSNDAKDYCQRLFDTYCFDKAMNNEDIKDKEKNNEYNFYQKRNFELLTNENSFLYKPIDYVNNDNNKYTFGLKEHLCDFKYNYEYNNDNDILRIERISQNLKDSDCHIFIYFETDKTNKDRKIAFVYNFITGETYAFEMFDESRKFEKFFINSSLIKSNKLFDTDFNDLDSFYESDSDFYDDNLNKNINNKIIINEKEIDNSELYKLNRHELNLNNYLENIPKSKYFFVNKHNSQHKIKRKLIEIVWKEDKPIILVHFLYAYINKSNVLKNKSNEKIKEYSRIYIDPFRKEMYKQKFDIENNKWGNLIKDESSKFSYKKTFNSILYNDAYNPNYFIFDEELVNIKNQLRNNDDMLIKENYFADYIDAAGVECSLKEKNTIIGIDFPYLSNHFQRFFYFIILNDNLNFSSCINLYNTKYKSLNFNEMNNNNNNNYAVINKNYFDVKENRTTSKHKKIIQEYNNQYNISHKIKEQYISLYNLFGNELKELIQMSLAESFETHLVSIYNTFQEYNERTDYYKRTIKCYDIDLSIGTLKLIFMLNKLRKEKYWFDKNKINIELDKIKDLISVKECKKLLISFINYINKYQKEFNNIFDNVIIDSDFFVENIFDISNLLINTYNKIILDLNNEKNMIIEDKQNDINIYKLFYDKILKYDIHLFLKENNNEINDSNKLNITDLLYTYCIKHDSTYNIFEEDFKDYIISFDVVNDKNINTNNYCEMFNKLITDNCLYIYNLLYGLFIMLSDNRINIEKKILNINLGNVIMHLVGSFKKNVIFRKFLYFGKVKIENDIFPIIELFAYDYSFGIVPIYSFIYDIDKNKKNYHKTRIYKYRFFMDKLIPISENLFKSDFENYNCILSFCYLNALNEIEFSSNLNNKNLNYIFDNTNIEYLNIIYSLLYYNIEISYDISLSDISHYDADSYFFGGIFFKHLIYELDSINNTLLREQLYKCNIPLSLSYDFNVFYNDYDNSYFIKLMYFIISELGYIPKFRNSLLYKELSSNTKINKDLYGETKYLNFNITYDKEYEDGKYINFNIDCNKEKFTIYDLYYLIFMQSYLFNKCMSIKDINKYSFKDLYGFSIKQIDFLNISKLKELNMKQDYQNLSYFQIVIYYCFKDLLNITDNNDKRIKNIISNYFYRLINLIISSFSDIDKNKKRDIFISIFNCILYHADFEKNIKEYEDCVSMLSRLWHNSNENIDIHYRIKTLKRMFKMNNNEFKRFHLKVIKEAYNMDEKEKKTKYMSMETDFLDSSEYKKLEFTNDIYSIISPKNYYEISFEGNYLSHCVEDYIFSVYERKTKIYFLRLNKNIDVPFITIEVEDNTIEQYYGYKDSKVENKEILKFIKQWSQKNNLYNNFN